MRETILVLESDPEARERIRVGLRDAGFEVTTESDAGRFLRRARSGRADAVVLDADLPGDAAHEVARAIRRSSRVPILMMSPRADPSEAVTGLESGADDYVRKPADTAEVVARLRALLRRSAAPSATNGHSQEIIRLDRLEIDPHSYRARKDGKELRLSATEFRLLTEMARSAGDVLSRDDLLDRVWGYDYLGESRLVDMAITRLRAKVEDDPKRPRLIHTVRGVGYRLDLPAGSPGAG